MIRVPLDHALEAIAAARRDLGAAHIDGTDGQIVGIADAEWALVNLQHLTACLAAHDRSMTLVRAHRSHPLYDDILSETTTIAEFPAAAGRKIQIVNVRGTWFARLVPVGEGVGAYKVDVDFYGPTRACIRREAT